VLNLILKARELGYTCVVINYRGGANLPLTFPLTYCAASSSDVREPINYLQETYS